MQIAKKGGDDVKRRHQGQYPQHRGKVNAAALGHPVKTQLDLVGGKAQHHGTQAVENRAENGEDHHKGKAQVIGLHKGQQPPEGGFGVFGTVKTLGLPASRPAVHGSAHASTSSADIWE